MQRPLPSRSSQIMLNLMVGYGLAFSTALIDFYSIGRLPAWVLIGYVVINLVTFVVYAYDKRAAQRQQWRISESMLHLLALGGGWIGAAAAHKWLRHKSSKPQFRLIFYVTVALHLLIWVAALYYWF